MYSLDIKRNPNDWGKKKQVLETVGGRVEAGAEARDGEARAGLVMTLFDINVGYL